MDPQKKSMNSGMRLVPMEDGMNASSVEEIQQIVFTTTLEEALRRIKDARRLAVSLTQYRCVTLNAISKDIALIKEIGSGSGELMKDMNRLLGNTITSLENETSSS